MIKKLAVLMALTGVLAGCTSPTLYRPMNSNGGVSDTQVSETIFKITSTVKNLSYPSMAEDYALIRAADITCYLNYPYFKVLDKNTQSMEGSRKPLVTTTTFMTIQVQNDHDSTVYEAKPLLERMKARYGDYDKKFPSYLSCPYLKPGR